ncbi:glycosyltransferase [Dongia sp.]|uniref:glycosyltransferase n=1 Tax=Dongia sp. TaxID=1977262 RepID=UPI0037523DDA
MPHRSANQPLKVAVLVTLERGPAAGGHVKSWERIAEVAAQRPDLIELDLHFLGPKRRTEATAPNVRFHTHRPTLGTRALMFLEQGAGHTDLAPFHPGIYAALKGSDVVHATDFFSFGKTAIAFAKRTGCGLSASVQTDVPRFTLIYAGGIIRRMFGPVIGSWLFVKIWRLPERVARGQQRGIDRRLALCDRILLSKPEDRDRLAKSAPSVRLFRRGIDRAKFNPARRDRGRLLERFGIPADRVVLVFAGRVDASKGAPLMAEAAKRLLDQGLNVHALVAGDGHERAAIGALLGERATLSGNLPQSELAWIYASADVFVFPSTTEVSPNVVLEAKASGLPVVVAADHGGGQFVARSGEDGIVLNEMDAGIWARAIAPLVVEETRRREIGRNARQWIEREWPDWSEVLERDLLAAWHEAALNGKVRHVDHARRWASS